MFTECYGFKNTGGGGGEYASLWMQYLKIYTNTTSISNSVTVGYITFDHLYNVYRFLFTYYTRVHSFVSSFLSL